MRRIFCFVMLWVVFFNTFVFSQDASNKNNGKVIAYYFHGSARCYSCNILEQYSKEAIEQNFKDELAEGKLLFKTVNVQNKANNHFISDYGLYSQSLVLSLVKDSEEKKFKNLTLIWQYGRDRQRFFNYVKDEVDNFLKELS